MLKLPLQFLNKPIRISCQVQNVLNVNSKLTICLSQPLNVFKQLCLSKPVALRKPLCAKPVEARSAAMMLRAYWDSIVVRRAPTAPRTRSQVMYFRRSVFIPQAAAHHTAQGGNLGQVLALILGHASTMRRCQSEAQTVSCLGSASALSHRHRHPKTIPAPTCPAK